MIYFAIVYALSRFGDFLFLLGERWFIVADLNQPTWIASLLPSFSVILGLVLMMKRFPKLERMIPNRIGVASATLIAAFFSGCVAVLALKNALSWQCLFYVTVGGTIVASLTSGHGDRYRREVGGSEQLRLSFLGQNSGMLARVFAGLTGGLIALKGTWALFALDSFSFLPMAAYALLSKPREIVPVTEASPISAIDGFRCVRKSRSMMLLFTLVLLQFNFTGVPFILTPEILKRHYGGGNADFGIWLAITGFAGFLGSLCGQRFERTGRMKTKAVFIIYGISLLSLFGAALSKSIVIYVIWYLLFVFFEIPADVVVDAELRLIDPDHLGAVGKARSVASAIIGPLYWTVIPFLGHKSGFGPERILLFSVILQTVLIVTLAVTVKRSGLGNGLITGKQRLD